MTEPTLIQRLVAWAVFEEMIVEQIRGGVSRDLYPDLLAKETIQLIQQHKAVLNEQIHNQRS